MSSPVSIARTFLHWFGNEALQFGADVCYAPSTDFVASYVTSGEKKEALPYVTELARARLNEKEAAAVVEKARELLALPKRPVKSVTDRITGRAIDVYQYLDGRQQADVDAYLEANPRAELYVPRDVVNAWLTWNGIIGYTEQIVSLIHNVNKG
jgi:hypothetical protein